MSLPMWESSARRDALSDQRQPDDLPDAVRLAVRCHRRGPRRGRGARRIRAARVVRRGANLKTG